MRKLLIILLLLLIASSANALSIENGSFETGLTGWDVDLAENSTATAVLGDLSLPASDGDYFLEISGPGNVSQQQEWTVGETLSFDWLLTDQSDNTAVVFTVFSPPTGLTSLTTDQLNGNIGWNTYTYTFVGEGSGFITFGSGINAPDNYHLIVDNVRSGDMNPSEPVPEPATMFLLGSGLMGVAVSRRKRKK